MRIALKLRALCIRYTSDRKPERLTSGRTRRFTYKMIMGYPIPVSMAALGPGWANWTTRRPAICSSDSEFVSVVSYAFYCSGSMEAVLEPEVGSCVAQ